MTHIAAALATFLDGLMAGVMLGSALVERSAKTLPAGSWIRYKQSKERVFGPLMPPLLGAAVVASAVAAAISPRHAAFGAAVLLLVAVFVVTGLVHVPLNRTMGGFSAETPPPEWAATRDRWRSWNWVRTAAAGLAFAAAVAGAAL